MIEVLFLSFYSYSTYKLFGTRWLALEITLDKHGKLTLHLGIVVLYYLCKVNFPQTTERRIVLKNRLEEIRKERGVNQEDLASVLEVSRQTISSLEKGRYNPSIILAFKIARYFEMSIEEIFIYEEEKNSEKQ